MKNYFKKLNQNVIFVCTYILIIIVFSFTYQQYEKINYENKIVKCVSKYYKQKYSDVSEKNRVYIREFCMTGYKK